MWIGRNATLLITYSESLTSLFIVSTLYKYFFFCSRNRGLNCRVRLREGKPLSVWVIGVFEKSGLHCIHRLGYKFSIQCINLVTRVSSNAEIQNGERLKKGKVGEIMHFRNTIHYASTARKCLCTFLVIRLWYFSFCRQKNKNVSCSHGLQFDSHYFCPTFLEILHSILAHLRWPGLWKV